MAQIDWYQKGHDYAYNWTPDSKLPEFPDDTAKQHFTDGYKTGHRRLQDLLATGTTKICC